MTYRLPIFFNVAHFGIGQLQKLPQNLWTKHEIYSKYNKETICIILGMCYIHRELITIPPSGNHFAIENIIFIKDRANYQPRISNRHCIARPPGRCMDCLSWVQAVVHVLPLSLASCMHYRVILHRVIHALHLYCELRYILCICVCLIVHIHIDDLNT